MASGWAMPGAMTCVQCQTEHDSRPVAAVGINRRGSKGSQLR
jgi:RNA polymerase-binding transcription factor DksA